MATYSLFVRPALVALSLSAMGCGAAVDVPDDTEAGVGGDSGEDAYQGRTAAAVSPAFGTTGACTTPCPTLPPKPDEACKKVDLECEYGDRFDPKCNTVARCIANGTLAKWSILAPTGACPTAAQTSTDVVCPSSPFGPERGKPCSIDGAVCTYTDGVCGCARGEGDSGADLTWSCATFTCKGPRMRLGCECMGGLACQHGGCGAALEHGVDLACNESVWKRPLACR